MSNHITPDYVARFIETSEKQFLKIEQYFKEFEERLNDINLKLETNKILTTEKNENLLYKLSVVQDKINANDQKINDLNNIMMKYFAYKSKNNVVPRDLLQVSTPSPSLPVLPVLPVHQQPFVFPK